MKTVKLTCSLENVKIQKLVSWIAECVILEEIEVSELVINGTTYISKDQAKIDVGNEKWARMIESVGYREL